MILAPYTTSELIFALVIVVLMFVGVIMAGLGIAMFLFGPITRRDPAEASGSAHTGDFKKDARLLTITGVALFLFTNAVG